MKHMVTLPQGAVVPALGIGTWHTAETTIPRQRVRESAALRAGISSGMRLIDTAEMYSEGESERLVGQAVAAVTAPVDNPVIKRGSTFLSRSDLFLVSKVYPWNAGRGHIFDSCKASLKRMGTDYLDLYLLHWRGAVPLAETVECMEELVEQGLIRGWGVSNFDVADMEELWSLPNGNHCQVDQVLYHVASRGIEFALQPWLTQHGVATMAYCPLAQGGFLSTNGHSLFHDPTIIDIAAAHHATAAQVLLAWVIRNGSTIAIPMSSTARHTRENAKADDLELTDSDLAAIDEAFPTPTHKVDLDTQ